jgi:hypothetical protein
LVLLKNLHQLTPPHLSLSLSSSFNPDINIILVFKESAHKENTFAAAVIEQSRAEHRDFHFSHVKKKGQARKWVSR